MTLTEIQQQAKECVSLNPNRQSVQTMAEHIELLVNEVKALREVLNNAVNFSPMHFDHLPRSRDGRTTIKDQCAKIANSMAKNWKNNKIAESIKRVVE